MESKLFALVHTGLLRQFSINTLCHEKNPKVRRKKIGMTVAYVIVGVVLALYCYGIAYGLCFMGLSEIVPGYALTITSIITLIFTFFKTNGVLFGSRDYDMLMAFPIKTTTVITAKFLSMYINNLIFAAITMISMGIGFCMSNPIGVGTVIMWFLAILLTPLIPMTIAAIVGTIIAAIGSGFRHKVLVQATLTAVLILGIMVGSFWVQEEAMKDEAAFMLMFADMGTSISKVIHELYPLSIWFDRAIIEGNVLCFLLFAGVSILIYVIFALICAKGYRKINTAMGSHHAVSNYKLGKLETSSVYMAIAKKEAKRLTSSTVYMINAGFGLLLALVLAVISSFTGADTIIESMQIQGTEAIKPLIRYLMPFAIAVTVNIYNTTCVSLSLEGRNLWVVQSLPITKRTLLKGKMLFNILLVMPVSLLCSIIYIFSLHISLVLALEYLLFSIISVLFSTVFGMCINVHFPNFTWQNEVEVVKQGASSMIGVFGGIISYLLLGIATFLLAQVMTGELALLIISGVLGLLAGLIYKTL